MTSELERLAELVRQMGDEGGPVRCRVAEGSLAATRLSAGVPAGVPSASHAAAALAEAGKHAAMASEQLDKFAQDATAFARRLVD